MKHSPSSRAFTIVELLVVVSIIALLVGILLPAIGKARDQAKVTQSQSNIKQLSTAVITYAAEWSDRQVTYVDDNLSRYALGQTSDAAVAAFTQYKVANGRLPAEHWIGQDAGVLWYWNNDPGQGGPSNSGARYVPYVFSLRTGAFRLTNTRPMNLYLNGRVYDPVFYAPKDSVVLTAVEPLFDHPSEFPEAASPNWYYASYCFSPAAMFNPAVLSKNSGGTYFTWPFTLEAGFRSPGRSQAQYPDLKTDLIEHNWLQHPIKACNSLVQATPGLPCEPYYFNAAFGSTPVTAFFDGHIAMAGFTDAMDADSRLRQQTTGVAGVTPHGIWSHDTPSGNNGYYNDVNVFGPNDATSYHVLTIDGIKGRDFVK
jgi:prepilin-type N-terminal cleavage/methylation domain-containing protein